MSGAGPTIPPGGSPSGGIHGMEMEMEMVLVLDFLEIHGLICLVHCTPTPLFAK